MGTFGAASQRTARVLETGLIRGLQVGAAGAAAGLGFAVKKAGDFEQQLSSLGAVAEANGKQMRRLREQALKAGADTAFSALEAAQAQTELAKGGLRVSQIMKGGLRSSLALAAAGEMELADAAEATVNAMKLFGLRGKDAMKVADGLATAANRTTADVSHFAMAFKMGGSAAKAAGLNFSETTAALEALAEIGIRGSDAGTSLKAMLTRLANPTEKMLGLMEDLGLKFFDAEGNMKPLEQVAGMLQKRLGGLTREQRLQTASTLAGTDGMRALLALYDAGPNKIGKFQRELDKEGTAAEVAKRKQDNLKGSLEQLSGSVETLAIQVGSAFIPVLRDAADELTEFSNTAGKILARDDLSLGDKLQRIFDAGKVTLRPWLDKLGTEIEQANIPEKLGRAFSKAVPVIAEAAAKGAGVATVAFVKGFLAADVWGRLAVGAWLLARMGGPPAFMKVGTAAGASVGAGMATGVAASGLKGKLATMFRAWGPTMGVALAATFGPELAKAAQKFRRGRDESKTRAAIAPANGDLAEEIRLLDERIAKLKENDTQLNRSRHRQDEFRESLERTRASLVKQRDELNKVAEKRWVGQIASNWKQVADSGTASMQAVRSTVQRNMQIVRDRLGMDSEAGKRAITRNFREAANVAAKQMGTTVAAIERAMSDGKRLTDDGSKQIRAFLIKGLTSLGLSKAQAQAKLETGTIQTSRGPGAGGGRLQRGGPINMGAPVGDSVPAVLERGEYVLNRNAVSKVGRQQLDRLNFGTAPRFQTGGIVEMLHPFNDPEGHGGSNSHLHLAASSVQAIVALGRKLQKLGWLVSEHPAFGGVNARHAPGGYHYTSQAIDVNWPDGGAEAAKIRALLPMLQGLASGAFAGALPKIPGLTTDLAGGPGALVNQGMKVARSAAQGVMRSVANQMSMVEGVEMGAAAGGMGKGALRKLWVQAGGDPSQANLMAAIALAESGGRPGITGPPDGRGLWQIEWPVWGKTMSGLGLTDPFDPLQNAKMARHVLKQQGLGAWVAYNSGNHRQFLQTGGPVGLAAGGGVGLGKAFKKLRGAKGRRARRDITRGLIDRIKDIGLPADMTNRLKTLETNSAVFGEMADRASRLTVTDEDGNAIPGTTPDGKTEVDWLQQQLQALFEWRNEVIQAEKVVVERREKVSALLEKARARLDRVRAQIRNGNAERKQVAEALEKAQKKPKKNRELIKSLKGRLGEIDKGQKQRFGVRDSILDVIGTGSSGLRGQRSKLNTARGDLLSTLERIQGVGSPMNVMSSLPGIGVLGGSLFDVQLRLQDLTAEKPKVTDQTGRSDGLTTSGLFDELQQVIANAPGDTLTGADLQAVLREIGDIRSGAPFGGSFATGGIVDGPRGAARIIEAHGGEGVFTPDQMRAMGGGGGGEVHHHHWDIQTLHPGDPRLKREIAQIVNGGQHYMGGRSPSRRRSPL